MRSEKTATVTVETTALFRKEVIHSISNYNFGPMRIAQPLSNWLIVFVAATISILLILFISFGKYAKKSRVGGVTIPTSGLITVAAVNPGQLVKIYVAEGSTVKKGDPLFEISTERLGNSGELTSLINAQIAVRKQSIDDERRNRVIQNDERKRAFLLKVSNLEAEKKQLAEEISLTQRRVDLAKLTVEKYKLLDSEGFMAAIQTQQKQEELIDAETKLSTLKRNMNQTDLNLLGYAADDKNSSREYANLLSQLSANKASLDQENVENRNRASNIIIAQEEGKLSAITSQVGTVVSAGQPLATLIPHSSLSKNDAEIEVNLYAPSKTTGFIVQGQRVLIRYQAYPYQKFGLYDGIVKNISLTPFSPSELPPALASTILSNANQNIQNLNTNEALYRIKVGLSQQFITIYGKRHPIKSGMTLEADILQDDRRIWEWIAEPLLAMAK